MTDPSPPAARIAALILAAGKSTRMKSKVPKALHPLLGKPLLRHAAEAAQQAGADRVVLVVGHQADQVQDAMGTDFEYVLQAEQNGTGHAVLMAESLLADWDGPLLVLPGDAPLITPSLLQSLLDAHRKAGAAATLLTAALDDAGSYGRIVRDPRTGRVQGIVEARDATPAQLQIREISTSIYAFHPARLFQALRAVTPQNAQGEYYLTDVVALLAAQGQSVEAVVSPDPDIVRGVNTRLELVELAQTMQARIHREHLLAGVTILDPLTTHIDSTVKIGQDTVIHPFTILSGVTDIGEDCQIGPGARISDSKIGSGVTRPRLARRRLRDRRRHQDRPVRQPAPRQRDGRRTARSATSWNSKTPSSPTASPPDTSLTWATPRSARAPTSARARSPATTTSSAHPTKSKTVIGADVFLGTHSTLVAPVTIGDDAYTAAGSVITEDVPPDALGLGRARQVNKEGWVSAKKHRQQDVS